MNIKNIIQRIQNTFTPKQGELELKDEVVLKFLQVLENAREEELSCSEMYARLDEFVENEVQAKDADKITPLIQEHLDMCPECCEEYEALLAILENTKEEQK
ncbi:MAG: hypothetical protein HYZ21_03930 [Chloroflexi bacterium]|nr:hypothetical protein [Chloroflexota bacterium]